MKNTMLSLDGTHGEGGGQILRSSLTLSLLTGTPFVMENVRGGRRKPGLLRQHLCAVQAAARIGAAQVEGDSLGSARVAFRPSGALVGGEHHFAVGSAGSAMLVLQTILLPLLAADGPSRVVLQGGTHNPWAPPEPFLQSSFLPALRLMGADVRLTMERPGFFPAGGGRAVLEVQPGPLRSLNVERGAIAGTRVVATSANLPADVARRELSAARAVLGEHVAVQDEQLAGSLSPGNLVRVEVTHGGHTA